MNAIYFINEQICLNGLSKEDSIILQMKTALSYLQKNNLKVTKLNPFQLNDYYTILHALLYDLKIKNSQLDCFLYYSDEVINDFIYSYPAKWLILKSFFDQVILLTDINKDIFLIS
jgi:hypothetical protein